MKSRTWCFDKTVFKKNLTRFAPAWGLYTVFLLMALVLIVDDSSSRDLASAIGEFAQAMCVFTPCYALLCAQLLFGDLYNSRMCNALHALPLRRETWFWTHVASGFVFHLVPTVIMAVCASILIGLTGYDEYWIMGPVWLLCVNLQFVCFFGIGVFSAFCVGSRFAQTVVYGILNFGSLIAGWLVDTLYTPMFYGVRTDLEPFFWFSPVAQMMENPFIYVERSYREVWSDASYGRILPGENFWYYFICAAVGAVLIGLALGLYKKRKLECAGDFMAVKGMEPVFQIVYTLVVGAVFHFVTADAFGMESVFFLFVGIAVGWFTGRMLLERTVRVFRWRSFAGCGILAAVFGATLVVAALDPFGIERWVPEREEVESVTISDGHYDYHNCEITLDEPEQIERILAIHREVLDGLNGEEIVIGPNGVLSGNYGVEEAVMVVTQEISKEDWETMDYNRALTFTYDLRSGRTVNRYYYVWMGGENGEYIRSLFSSAQCVFGYEENVDLFLVGNGSVVIQDTYEGMEKTIYSDEELRSLYEAILADCEAGTMAQDWEFHPNESNVYWLNFQSGLSLMVFTDSESTLQWLRDNGFDVDAVTENLYY